MQKTSKKTGLRFLAAVLFAFILLTAAAISAHAESVGYFYANSETGDDHRDGLTAENAVKTFTQACRYAINSGVDKAYIVITNEYPIPKTVKELAHPNTEFVLTTNDGMVDYGATNGAKIVYGSGLRYYLNGNTTFDDILFTYTKSVVFVAQYNHITFGEKFANQRIDAEDNVVYIVGGFQSPLDTFDTSLDSHITIKNGDFDYVIAGSRQKGEGAKGTTFYGTHHVDVSGGKVAKLFGGSYANQISDSAVINVTGGEIDVLYAAGDATRRLENDATITLSGGTVNEVHVNNVIGAATVTLGGAKVNTLDVTFANAEQTTNARKANKPDSLYYDAQYFTKEQIESFRTSFDTVENIAKIYVKNGAKGSGASEDDPTSFENAIKIAGETEAVVVVIGSIKLNDFTEPAHEGTITIKGVNNVATLQVDGTYTFGGKTVFKEMRLSGKGTLDARNGCAVIESTVGSYFTYNALGSVELYAGKLGTVTEAEHVMVSGATVGTITGATKPLNVEVLGGTVGTITTTETAIDRANLSVSGGTVDKIVFNNVKKELTYLLYGGEVKAYEVGGDNVTGTLKMDTALFTLDSLGAAASLFEQKTDVIYFLSDAGTGNGTSVNAAGNSLADAYAAIGDNNGTIVIVGPYTIPTYNSKTAFLAEKHSGNILYTSVYGGVDYRETADASLIILNNLYFGGDTAMDGINIINKKSYGGFFAGYNRLTIGADIVTAPGGKTAHYPSLIGGTDKSVFAAVDRSSEIVINGGTWQRVRLGSSNGSPLNVNVKMTINKGTFKETVALATPSSHTGDLTLVVNGGTFEAGIIGASMSKDEYSYTGTMTIELAGGDIYRYVKPTDVTTGTFHGQFNVIIRDQNPAHLVDIRGTEGLKGDMISTLYVSENVDINADITGTYSFTNPVRGNGADPWLFFHDGYYYYTATAGSKLTFVKAANIGDLSKTPAQVFYAPEAGHEWSSDLWSPEVHYFSEADVGTEHAGWYCFLGSQPDDAYYAANGKGDDPAGFGDQRAYVLKCLDGDNLLGRWGNPVTGEVNVPQKIAFPDSDFNDKELTGGCSILIVDGVKYITFISEVGRDTINTPEKNFYQTINIAKFTNPWTIEGQPKVICRPEYEWEKGGSHDAVHPEVVEGCTAVYGPNGEIYIIYSGSGYWTQYYQLGQLTFLGGDPTDINNWKKKPTSIFSQSSELVGCGHASYVTDTDGQGWICYHAYPKGSDERRAYVEPYYFTEEGVVIGNRSGHPAPLSTVYTANVNPAPISTKVSGFGKTETYAEKFGFDRDYDGRFTDVTEKHWFYSFVKNAYRIGLANGTSSTKFSPDSTFTVAAALTVAANTHTIYNGTSVRAAAQGEAWYVPYVEYCVQNGIITEGQFTNMDANITRGDMAIVFANVLPESEYAAIHSGSNPDVTADMACASAVSKLYKAGIVGGDAGTGNYRPNDSIKRSEACVIFSRIAMQGERIK